MIKYAEDHFDQIESKQDNCRPHGQGADGYGIKISMPYLVRFNNKGPWKRVFCTCISNCRSVWCLVSGEQYHFRCDNNLKLTGIWPKSS